MKPISRRQVFSASSANFHTIVRGAVRDPQPFVRLVRSRTVAYVDSIGLLVRRCTQWAAGNASHDDLGAPPLFIPLVVTTAEVEITLDAAADGVAALWHGLSVRLLKGAKLLIAPPFQLRSSLLQLLSFELDEHLGDGQFEVRPDTNDGFKFIVALAADLHGFLRHPRALRNRRNIMTHIVSAALALLRKDYGEDDGEEGWRTHGNLKALADYLEAQGLPLWVDGFHPERVATALYPHLFPQSGEEDH